MTHSDTYTLTHAVKLLRNECSDGSVVTVHIRISDTEYKIWVHMTQLFFINSDDQAQK